MLSASRVMYTTESGKEFKSFHPYKRCEAIYILAFSYTINNMKSPLVSRYMATKSQ